MVMTFSSQYEWPATDPTHRYFVVWGVALADNFVNMALLIISLVDLKRQNTSKIPFFSGYLKGT